MKKEKTTSGFWGNIIGLGLAVFTALGIRSVLIEPYNIPSSSMVPTLLIGDYLFVTKYPYGFSKHSFPLSVPLIPTGRLFGSLPKQGDVIIFKEPKSNKIDYIKRVIGLPHDTVQMKSGRLYINGEQVQRILIKIEDWPTERGVQTYTRYLEKLPAGHEHFIYEISDNMLQDDTPLITVPDGHIFVMGDNRDNSEDSRFFGFVPVENVQGRAEFIFYSNNGKGAVYEPWKWSAAMRPERFFTRIH